MNEILPPNSWVCLDCGVRVTYGSLRCWKCYNKNRQPRKRHKFKEHLDWSPRLCQLAERAAAGIPLFQRSDRPRSGIGRAIQASRPVRCIVALGELGIR